MAQAPERDGLVTEVRIANHEQTISVPALTGVRFCAALLVVLCHFWFFSGSSWIARTPLWFTALVRIGSIGVGVFFTLSGYILMMVYGGADFTIPKVRHDFWVARLARVYPAYLLSLLVTTPFVLGHRFAGRTLFRGTIDCLVSFGSSAMMIQAWIPALSRTWNGPGWSLSAEAFFLSLVPDCRASGCQVDCKREVVDIVGVLAGAHNCVFGPVSFGEKRPTGRALKRSTTPGLLLSGGSVPGILRPIAGRGNLSDNQRRCRDKHRMRFYFCRRNVRAQIRWSACLSGTIIASLLAPYSWPGYGGHIGVHSRPTTDCHIGRSELFDVPLPIPDLVA
jgi:hypothetical protein